MDEFYNKHYITLDEQNRVTDGWSDGPHPGRDTAGAVCINGQGGYQFRLSPGGEENPSLYDVDGIPLYRWDGAQAVKRTAEEIAADRAAEEAANRPDALTENLKEVRRQRARYLKAFDIYKSNVSYGVETETEEQKAEVLAWYSALLDITELVTAESVPEFPAVPACVARYL